jgi:hypothetical protein
MARSARIRLIAVVVLAVSVLALAGAGMVRAGNGGSLPGIAADRLLASTARALVGPVTISGDVETRIELGLPEIPAGLGGEGGLIAMVNGTQRFRVWHAAQGLRIAHITQVSERDLVVNAHEAWWWDGAEMTATRLRFDDAKSPAGAGPAGWMTGEDADGSGSAAAAALAADPVSAARRAIETLSPFASVSVEGDEQVADRSVYTLVLTPLTDETLIARIEISIDATTRLPLRIAVVSRATGEVAMSAGFSSVSFDPIDPAVFSFTPPDGAEVNDALDRTRVASPPMEGARHERADGFGQVRSFGEGFATRIAVPLPADAVVPEQLTQLLPYAGPLASVMVADVEGERWLLVGAVPLSTLQSDVASLT